VFVQVERPRLLEYASTMTLPDRSSFDTRMHVTFESKDGKTRLTIVQGEDVIIAGSVSDDEAREIYPEGWKAPKPYIRIVRQPS
jgi:activator of Hsp90 ATPase-like protein